MRKVISKFCKYFKEGINQTMAVIGKEIQEYPDIETRITILKAIPALVSFDPSVVGGDSSGYKQMIEAILTLLQDTESSVSLLSRCILRELIKAYSQFPRVIKKLSYLHRQDLIQMLIEATNDK